jgi:hypothetical protein
VGYVQSHDIAELVDFVEQPDGSVSVEPKPGPLYVQSLRALIEESLEDWLSPVDATPVVVIPHP